MTVSACGFQLRGSANNSLSGSQIYLVQNEKLDADNNFRSFQKVFKRGLIQASAELVSGLEQSNVVELNIVNLEFTSQAVSRDATGRANEHEVSLKIDYKINDATRDSEKTDTLEQEQIIHSLTVSASYYQDYHNPTAGRLQKKETHKILTTRI